MEKLDWNPNMDEAPKDGTPVLVWFRGKMHVAEYASIWHPDNKRWAVRNPATSGDEEERIVHDLTPPMFADGTRLPGGHKGPTHWMPLPSPPQETEE